MVAGVRQKTGRVLAHSSLEDTGNHVIPYEDTFNRENDYIHGLATYLAVLWTGNVSPSTMIDTGNGEISLEYALTHRSEVGLAKAIEMAYKNDRDGSTNRHGC